MFTGIVESAGTVARIASSPDGARLAVRTPLAAEAKAGESIAVNGVCLTVVACGGDILEFDVVHETLRRSNLGDLDAGARVNLERPVRADGRFDGHIVQGHVDAAGMIAGIAVEGGSRRLRITADAELLKYVVEKGSIAVDGISLTVAAVSRDWFEVVIIPHTWAVTNLGPRPVGARVNLEVDLIAKYVERLLGGR